MHLSVCGANPVVVGIYFSSSLDKAQYVRVLASLIVCSGLYCWYYCNVRVQKGKMLLAVSTHYKYSVQIFLKE